jgi:hypothetical protein
MRALQGWEALHGLGGSYIGEHRWALPWVGGRYVGQEGVSWCNWCIRELLETGGRYLRQEGVT